jgi:hypothetical protein
MDRPFTYRDYCLDSADYQFIPMNRTSPKSRPITLAAEPVAAVAAVVPGVMRATHEHSLSSVAAVPESKVSPSACEHRAAVDESWLPSDRPSAIRPCSRHPISLSWIRESFSSPLFDHRSDSVLASRYAFFLRAALARQVPLGSDLAPESVNRFVHG